jgi:hypothetical protein
VLVRQTNNDPFVCHHLSFHLLLLSSIQAKRENVAGKSHIYTLSFDWSLLGFF